MTLVANAAAQGPVVFTTILRTHSSFPTELRLAQPMEPDVVVVSAQAEVVFLFGFAARLAADFS